MAAKKKNVEVIDPKIFQILGPYVDGFTLRSIYASGPRGHFYTKLYVVDKLKLRVEQVLEDYPQFYSNGIHLYAFGEKYVEKFLRPFQFDGRGVALFIGIYCRGTYHVSKNRIWYTPNHPESSDSESEPEPEPVKIQTIATQSVTGQQSSVALTRKQSYVALIKRVKQLRVGREDPPVTRRNSVRKDSGQLLRAALRRSSSVQESPGRVHHAWRTLQSVTGTIGHFTRSVRGVHHFYTMSAVALNAAWNLGTRASSFWNEHKTTLIDIGLVTYFQDYMAPTTNVTMAIEAPVLPE